MIEAEAVLCEDGRTVLVYLYQHDDLVGTRSQSLPLTISDGEFEEIRPEWERVWEATGLALDLKGGGLTDAAALHDRCI
ncbi:hypothetical protein EDE05_11447 [Neorhizobium sp. R1-B]|uniref:hypothetical protein n=1 Tax=Neorhizobium sp. R1-B TaxID=2485162 RepID=UPI001065A284|nr:hypothetical protein [Neorhizobium sp. R1-B]TDX77738.1 hypothetical protein EDE05_11447 [Neorhizobium sp. R1-B]